MKERIAKYDNYKVLLIFLVVLGHSLAYVEEQGGIIQFAYVVIYSFHMPAFMYISGLFSRKAACRFRFEKVLSYFLLFLVIILAKYLVLRFCGSQRDFLFSSGHGSAWFAFAVMVFLVLIYLFRNCHPVWLLAFSVILSLISGLSSEISNTFSLDRIISFFPYYIAGIYGPSPEKLLDCSRKRSVKLISIVFLLLFLVFVRENYHWLYQNALPVFRGRVKYTGILGLAGKTLWYPVSSAISLSVMMLIPERPLGIISEFGRRTISVYALHNAILLVLYWHYRLHQSWNGRTFTLSMMILISAAIVAVLSTRPMHSLVTFFITPKLKSEKD